MRISLKTRFWYWVYRWSHRLTDYSEGVGDTRYASEAAKVYWDDHGGSLTTNGGSLTTTTTIEKE